MNVQDKKVFPWEIQDLPPEEAEKRNKYFKDSDVVSVGPKSYLLPDRYKKLATDIYNLQLRSDDIYVVGFPRTGTNWTQELVWLVANDINFEIAKTQGTRLPFLEISMLFGPEREQRLRRENINNEEFLQFLGTVVKPIPELMAGIPSPRIVKSHLPLSLLPPDMLETTKVVYVARDPRDVAVSYYHFVYKSVGDFKTFWNFFIKDACTYTPYFEHVKEAWNKRQHRNMLFLFYEELAKDLPDAVKRVSNFLNKKFTEEQISQLCDHLSFDNYKKSKSGDIEQVKSMNGETSAGAYIRKGKAGGWRDYFDAEMTQQAEHWIAENLQDTDLCLPTFQ